MSLCVTGANGFIGQSLLQAGQARGLALRGTVRQGSVPGIDCHQVGDMGPATDWARALAGMDTVLHLAGLAHAAAEVADYERVNEVGTLRLADQAVKAGVQRLVFVSSIAVYPPGAAAIDATTEPAPANAYGASKWRAEQGLWQLARNTDLEVVVVRPALVVGRGAPGNLQRLASLIARGLPLPVPLTPNARSYVSLTALVDLLLLCARHPDAAGRVWLAADEQTPSTRDVMQWIAGGMAGKLRTVPVPGRLLYGAAAMAGQGETYHKLYGDLRVDAGQTRSLLGWQAAGSLREAFFSLGAGFRQAGS